MFCNRVEPGFYSHPRRGRGVIIVVYSHVTSPSGGGGGARHRCSELEKKSSRAETRASSFSSRCPCALPRSTKNPVVRTAVRNLFTACSRSSLFLSSFRGCRGKKRRGRSEALKLDTISRSLIARGDAKGMKISSSGIKQPSSSRTDILRFFSRWRRIGSVIVCLKASYCGWTNDNVACERLIF